MWAHQHLLESRKRVAQHFAGNKLLELTFSVHCLIIWCNLTYDEESEHSSIHNLLSHDVNTESIMDRLYKLRISWTKHGCFEWLSQTSEEVLNKKLQVFKTIGIGTKTEMNSFSWMLRIACAPQAFFDKVMQVAEAHKFFKLKGMKAPLSSKQAMALASGSKVKGRGKGEVSNASKYAGVEEGPDMKQQVFKDISWIRLDADYEAIGIMLENVRLGVDSLDEFNTNHAKYKDMKFLRIQLRVKVRHYILSMFVYL